MKSKILFILHIPPPIDGAAMMGKYIKESPLINDSFEADYINLTSAFSLETIGKGNLIKIGTIINILKEVLQAISAKKYDYCYMTLTAKGAGFYKDFLVVILLKLFGLNIIYHFHNKGVSISGKKWYNHLLYKVTFHNSKCILLAESLYYDIQTYVRKENIFICNNGIPNLKIDTISRSKPQISGNSMCKFLFLSNMMKEKGVLVFLEAAKLLQEKGYIFECHYVGAWSDIAEQIFTDKVKALGLNDNIFMHGPKTNGAKIALYDMADVFVFPTYYHNECFPLVLLEAMHCSLPVISTPEGAIADIVTEGETGLLTPQQDVKKLAVAMEYLLSHPEERLKMGIEGRRKYEKLYTRRIFEKCMLEILSSVLISAKKQIPPSKN